MLTSRPAIGVILLVLIVTIAIAALIRQTYAPHLVPHPTRTITIQLNTL